MFKLQISSILNFDRAHQSWISGLLGVKCPEIFVFGSYGSLIFIIDLVLTKDIDLGTLLCLTTIFLFKTRSLVSSEVPNSKNKTFGQKSATQKIQKNGPLVLDFG